MSGYELHVCNSSRPVCLFNQCVFWVCSPLPCTTFAAWLVYTQQVVDAKALVSTKSERAKAEKLCTSMLAVHAVLIRGNLLGAWGATGYSTSFVCVFWVGSPGCHSTAFAVWMAPTQQAISCIVLVVLILSYQTSTAEGLALLFYMSVDVAASAS